MGTQVVKTGGDGFYAGGAASAGTKWEAVQLAGGAYLYFGGANSYSATLLASDVALVPVGAKILSVGVRMLANGVPAGANVRFGLRLGGVNVVDAWSAAGVGPFAPIPATGYTTLARPGGGVWDPADLGTLELIVGCDAGSQFDMIDCLVTTQDAVGGWMCEVY